MERRGIMSGMLFNLKLFFKYDVPNFFMRPIRSIAKYYQWFKFLRDDVDFDSWSVYRLLAFKLERIEKSLLAGIAVHEKEDLEALRESIELLHKLYKDEYVDKYSEAHEAKWGKLKITYGKANKQGIQQLIFKRENEKTPEDRLQSGEELRNYYNLANEEIKADREKLVKLLEKYFDSWWD